MTFVYVSADAISPTTGAGKVVYHEANALALLGEPTLVVTRLELEPLVKTGKYGPDPWCWDNASLDYLANQGIWKQGVKLVHGYGGTFSKLISLAKAERAKTTWTCAAHDIEASKQAHEAMGIPFNYPHLTDPNLWKEYSRGYMECDVLICPSSVAADTCRKQGRTGPIEVIPHGTEYPETIKPLPKRFTCGYLGSTCAADKGVRYLLEAWKKLDYRDATLILGGKDSTSDFAKQMVNQFGGGAVWLAGWQDNVWDFYSMLSCLCQPSATEGWGCEVVEALACGRPVICSDGAGAVDALRTKRESDELIHGCGLVQKAGDVNHLCSLIDAYKTNRRVLEDDGERARKRVADFTWDKVMAKYQQTWKGLLQ